MENTNKFIVEGGKKLQGEVNLKGYKNNSIKLIPASMMIDGEVKLYDMPDLLDVRVALQIFQELGGRAEFNAETGECLLDGRGITSFEINPELSKTYRASVSYMGPLYAKFGRVKATFPGGDKIGVRDIDTHFQVFRALGAEIIDSNDGNFIIQKKDTNSKIMLEQPSVMATENAINATIFTQGITTIYNAACEPHVQDLCNFLNKAGAKISGIGSNLLQIEGVEKLNSLEYKLDSDPLDAGMYVIAACMTKGEVRINNVNLEYFQPIWNQFKKFGMDLVFEGNSIIVKENQNLVINNTYWGGVYSQPWPMFPTDLMSPTIALATQSEGHLLFFEKMYEGRMNWTSQLNNMGANVFLVDPHRVIVYGKTKLYGAQVTSLDVRAGVAVLLSAMTAEGKSEIEGIKHIDRAYDHLDRIFNSLGASIQRV